MLMKRNDNNKPSRSFRDNKKGTNTSNAQKQKQYRRRTRYHTHKKYSRSRKGVISNAYHRISYKIKANAKQIGNSHCDALIMPKNEFKKWAISHEEFIELHDEWKRREYDTTLTPTLSRIDPRFGFEDWNLLWVTAAEARRRIAAFKHHGKIL